MLTLITGGVRSGKSAFAEKLAYTLLTPKRNHLLYIATSKRYDTEMCSRIQKHQEERKNSGYYWETLEQETQLERLLPCLSETQVILIDCLTTLVANELFTDFDKWSDSNYLDALFQRIITFFINAKKKQLTLIIVSNELLNGGLSYDQATITYLKFIGQIHQQLVQIVSHVFLVEAGLPLKMKGCDYDERNYASRY